MIAAAPQANTKRHPHVTAEMDSQATNAVAGIPHKPMAMTKPWKVPRFVAGIISAI
jgi:hypothetical protein